MAVSLGVGGRPVSSGTTGVEIPLKSVATESPHGIATRYRPPWQTAAMSLPRRFAGASSRRARPAAAGRACP